MASLEQRNENYRIVFRFEGRKYSRSLSTNNVTEANGMLASVEQRLKLIKTNVLPAPDANIDIVEYLVHGLSTPIKEAQEIVSKFESLTDVCERYFECFLRSSIEEESFPPNTGGFLTGFKVCKRRSFSKHLLFIEKDPNMSAVIESLDQRLTRIEKLLTQLVDTRVKKEYYSTSEIAQLLSRAEFTVREWARNGRIWAEKRQCGRGNTKEWMISHVELVRIQNEGLLPNK
jgi:hypothetical protein